MGTRYQGTGFGAEQRVIHVDVDAGVFGRTVQPELAIAGDAKVTLERLLVELDARLSHRESRGSEYRAAKTTLDAQFAAVGPQLEMVQALRRGLPEEGIIGVGTTTVGYMCHLAFPVYRPRSYLTSSYMGTLGYCFPTCLGAKVAKPDVPVVSVNGDGGFLFTSSELATAMHYGINIVSVVFNDAAYGNTNRDQVENFGGRVIGTELTNPDFTKYAEAFGAVGVRVPDVSHLEGAIREGLADTRPVVIELAIDRLPNAL